MIQLIQIVQKGDCMYLIIPQGNVPIFEQIKNQTKQFIHLGVFKPHEKLPSVRNLAADLGINPNTVARAYQELTDEGIIYSLPKKGAFVSDFNEGNHVLKEQFMMSVQKCRKVGIRDDELIEWIKEREEDNV